MAEKFTRRQLLQTTAQLGMGVWLTTSHRARAQSPNEKLNIAIIGAGGRGEENLAAVGASQNIVALCDVDQRRAARMFGLYTNVPKYADFRKMLEAMDRQIDAVVVSTTNHTHAPASVMAMRMGKHCYCEKPLTHSIHEARVVAQVAAETKVATQMGTQIHASETYRRIVELIQSGAIGPVREVHLWLRGGRSAGDRPSAMPPIPEGLDWDLWLGPAPWRPYHPCYVPHDWHYWWDFGGGEFGNMGCHYLDLAFWALKLRSPEWIEASGSPVHPESTPGALQVRYEFAARGELPPVAVTWTHGPNGPAIFQDAKLPNWVWGVFVGSEGMLAVSYGKWLLLPEAKFAGFQPPEPTIPPSPGHHEEWLTACKAGSPTSCNFDYSGAVTEAMLLGNVAYRVGRRLQWDAANLRFPNCPEAERYLRRTYREGWTL